MTAKSSFWMPALLAAGVCIALCGLVSGASPQLPCEFYGTITVQGSPAPVGTVISAFVNGTSQGEITVTKAGEFGGMGTFDERLIVMTGENDFANGAPSITFKVNGQNADQTAAYQPGASSAINLTVGGQGIPAQVQAPVQPVNGSSQVPVVVAHVSTPVPTPVPTIVQNQSPAVQTANYTATQSSCSAAAQ